MDMKNSGEAVMITPRQQKWVSSRKSLYGRSGFFNLTNLQELTPNHRKLYDFISAPRFDNFIMGCIIANTLIMAFTIFPEPTEWWNEVADGLNYLFAVIFTGEAVLKIAALRKSYFI